MTIKEILKKLISFPVLGGESNHSILEWIERYLIQHDIQSIRVPHEIDAKASLHCRIGPPADGGIVWSGHMDVVPVEGQDWNTGPFDMQELNQSLYGRGTCDMKGFLACCLFVIPYLKTIKLRRPIYLAFSYDEEIGCLAAPALIRHMKSFYHESIRFAIIGEPTLMQVCQAHKGICVFKTTVVGSAGHSSRILEEVSAVHIAARLIMWLENKMKMLMKSQPVDSRFDPPYSTIHIGKIQGGIAPNVIADHCTFYWDVRVLPGTKLEEIIADFSTFTDELVAKIQLIFTGASIRTNRHHPPVPPLHTPDEYEIIQFTLPLVDSTVVGAASFATEAGQFSEAGIPSVICGPGSIEQAHRANEFVDLGELEKCISFLCKIADKQTEDES